MCSILSFKKFLIRIGFFSLLNLSIFYPTHSQEMSNLNININNIKEAKGTMMVAVYTTETKFLGKHFFKSAAILVTKEDSQTCNITLPFGQYAVAIYQDLNQDSRINKNFFGIPTEPYGFSNDSMGMFGPPDFEEAAFDFRMDQQSIDISLK